MSERSFDCHISSRDSICPKGLLTVTFPAVTAYVRKVFWPSRYRDSCQWPVGLLGVIFPRCGIANAEMKVPRAENPAHIVHENNKKTRQQQRGLRWKWCPNVRCIYYLDCTINTTQLKTARSRLEMIKCFTLKFRPLNTSMTARLTNCEYYSTALCNVFNDLFWNSSGGI